MGWRFRRSITVIPGVRVNVGKTGITSVSVGRRGARATIGKRGVTHSIGLPGTGLSHVTHTPYSQVQTTMPSATGSKPAPADWHWLWGLAASVAFIYALLAWSATALLISMLFVAMWKWGRKTAKDVEPEYSYTAPTVDPATLPREMSSSLFRKEP